MTTETVNNQATGILPENLVIRLGAGGLCFARYSGRQAGDFSFGSRRFEAQLPIPINLNEAFRSEPLLRTPAKSTAVIVSSGAVTVPLSVFQEEDCEDYYNCCCPPEKGKRRRVFYDTVSPTSTAQLFCVDEEIWKKLRKTVPEARYFASVTPMLRHFATKSVLPASAKRIFTYVHEEMTDIMAFEGQRLLIANTFETPDTADSLYFTLSIATQLEMPLETSPIYVCGPTETREHIAAQLRDYAKNVMEVNPSAEYIRHPVATTPGVPYDMVTFLLG